MSIKVLHIHTVACVIGWLHVLNYLISFWSDSGERPTKGVILGCCSARNPAKFLIYRRSIISESKFKSCHFLTYVRGAICSRSLHLHSSYPSRLDNRNTGVSIRSRSITRALKCECMSCSVNTPALYLRLPYKLYFWKSVNVFTSSLCTISLAN